MTETVIDFENPEQIDELRSNSVLSVEAKSQRERIEKELRDLAESNADALDQSLKFKELNNQTGVGKRDLKDLYQKIRRQVESERQPAAVPPKEPTAEELEANKDRQAAAEAEEKERHDFEEEVAKRAKEISEAADIPKLFEASLRKHQRYVASYEVAGSILISQVSRLSRKSSGNIVNGGTASGKTDLIDKCTQYLPPESVERLTSSSDKSLYYKGDIAGKYIVGGELKLLRPGEDDPFQQALRQLISDNYISREISEKDANGQMSNKVYLTTGPAVFMLTTTAEITNVNDEFVNRLSVIQSDETEATTALVLHQQALAAECPLTPEEERNRSIELAAWQQFHRDMRSLRVIIPYASLIKPTSRAVTMRRLFPLLLNYISMSTLLHQAKRIVDETRQTVEADLFDYELAFKLLNRNAPRVNDPVGDKAREFYHRLKKVFGNNEFKRADIQTNLRLTKPTAARYLDTLKDAGCVTATGHKEGRAPLYHIDLDLPPKEDPGLVKPGDLDKLLSADDSTQFDSK